MSLGEHLVELRKRLTVIGVAVVVAAIGGWFLADVVWAALSQPLLQVAEEQGREATINYTAVTEAFDTKLVIAVVLGVIIASPIWLYQLWAFVVPALHKREKRYAIGFLASALPLFLAGCAAGWFVLPHVVELLTSFAPTGTSTLLTAKVYLDFSLKLILAVGIGFVLPVFLVVLNFARVLSGAAILRGWRWAILAITVFTALATPAADIMSMFLLAVPMVGLYFLAAGISSINDRRVARREAVLAASYGLVSDG
jgi:sec-independent protein translocase protein TatC